jgi:hypothetical protein
MLNKSLIGLAILIYLIAAGCAMTVNPAASSASPNETAEVVTNTPPSRMGVLPFCGCGMQIQRVDWIDRYEKSIDEVAAIGGDTVLLVVDARMENGTPTPDQLSALIDHAKARKLRVILMPIVLLDDPKGDEWRGTLKPENWDTWWDSYRDMITHFSWIAEGHHVDVLVVGSELVSTENKLDQWTQTISAVRKVFHGMLTYSANWDHYTSVPFWNQLDLISTNSYYKLGEDHNVSLSEIEQRWQDIQRDLLGFTRKKHLPLLFTEVGWCSMANAADAPWDYTQESVPQDDALQKKLYEGFFRSWWGNPAYGGFMIWEWSPGDGGNGDEDQRRGYTPKNKPAEQILRQWFGKPRWKVDVH